MTGKTDNPLVTIIVRTKDRPKLLRRALQSIAAQTYRPIEVVLVNDGGCDLDIEELKTILGDVFLNYIRLEKNTGRAHAGNVGIENAKGEYIGFLDDDDEFYPEHVETLAESLTKGEVKVSYSDCEIIKHLDNSESDDNKTRECFLSFDFDPLFLSFTNYIPFICLLFRKEVFDNLRFDETFELYEDWDILIRLSQKYDFIHIRHITALYHKWSNDQITTYSTKKNSEIDKYYYMEIIKKYREIYTPETLYKIYNIYNHQAKKLLTLLQEKERLKSEIINLSIANKSLLQEKERLKNEITNLSIANKSLLSQIDSSRTEIAALSTTLNRIYSSKGWRVLKKYYNVKEFILGTGDSPNIKDRMFSFIKRLLKKTLPKKFQVYIKFLHYRLQNIYTHVAHLDFANKNEKEPFISIVIPVYNKSSFLLESIESALKQDYDKFEVVVVDDFSTENKVKEILAQLSNEPRIRIYFNDRNTGISETLNRAIINSKGDYIAFLDCDDILPQSAISKVASIIKQNPDKGYFFSDRINVDSTGKEIEKVTFINRKKDNYFRELMKGMFTDHLKIIKRKAFLEVGLLDKLYDTAQDYDFALRYAIRYPTGFYYINDFLYYHRVYPDQISSARAEHQKRLAQKIKEKGNFINNIKTGKFDKKISIVILSFNKKEHTIRCIESIKDTVKCNYEIVLFDNASNKETVDTLHRNYSNDPRVKLFFSSENLGCPRGRKKAITFTDGDYIITLDNDIVVTDGWIEELLTRLEEDSSIAGACCKVIFPDGKIQYNGGKYVIRGDFIEFSLHDAWKSVDDLSTMKKLDCDWIPGGATIYKREIYEKVQICEDYENAYEDNDFSLEVKKLGYRIVNCPLARAIHNHVYYDKKTLSSEKEYMQSRYNNDALKRSVVTFYRRQGLIIRDEYIFKIFGFNGLGDEEIKAKFLSLINIQ